MKNMSYAVTRTSGAVTLTIEGRLDTLAAMELENGIAPLLSDPGNALTIAIPDLSYISSSGLRCFVRLYNVCKNAGASFAIVGATPAVKEIFDMTGFSRIFGL